MSARDDYPAGVPCWVETLQPDPRAALGFYGPLLGWEFGGAGPMPAGLPGEYFVAEVDGRRVAGVGALPGPAPAAVWNTHVRVDDAAAAAAARAAEQGGSVLLGPLGAPEAGRLALLTDPAGAAFTVQEPAARFAAVLLDPGGAAFSISAVARAL